MNNTPYQGIILGMDSSESQVYGDQEGSAYNSNFECNCFHPLFYFNQFVDCEEEMLWPGNVRSTDCWEELPEPTFTAKSTRILDE
jgi:hypothetical protein